MLIRRPTRLVRDFSSDSSRWDNYRPRPNDIVIATGPKVGTTWTQQIVNLLVFQSPEPRSLGPLSPWIEARFRDRIDQVLSAIERQTHRRFLKSHLPLDALPFYDEVKYIHVARDGRDACMSLFNHFVSFTPQAIKNFDRIGLSDETIGRPFPKFPKTAREFYLYWIGEDGNEPMSRAESFFELERSYWSERRRPNMLLVHYNDLKADLSAEMKRIADFLGIATPAHLWPQLVEAASFEAMKRDGGTLMAGAEFIFQGGHKSFLHKGTNDRWRDVLTDADLALYERNVKSHLSPTLISWLTHGRRKAGDPRESPD